MNFYGKKVGNNDINNFIAQDLLISLIKQLLQTLRLKKNEKKMKKKIKKISCLYLKIKKSSIFIKG